MQPIINVKFYLFIFSTPCLLQLNDKQLSSGLLAPRYLQSLSIRGSFSAFLYTVWKYNIGKELLRWIDTRWSCLSGTPTYVPIHAASQVPSSGASPVSFNVSPRERTCEQSSTVFRLTANPHSLRSLNLISFFYSGTELLPETIPSTRYPAVRISLIIAM